MPGRTRRQAAAQTAPEPETTEAEEAASTKRGPSELTMLFVKFLKDEYGVDADPEVVYLAQTTRKEFRDTPAYEQYLQDEDARKEEAAKEKERRAAERKAKADEAPAEGDEAPAAKPARRGRKAAAPAAEATEAEAPVETTRTRSRRRGTAATTEAPAAETAAPAKAAGRKRAPAPF
jgi:hypothetical protein